MTALRCHYCFSKSQRGPVVGWIVEMRAHGLVRYPVCDRHRVVTEPTYHGDRVLFQPLDGPALTGPDEPCGAHAVVEWFEGQHRTVRWCDRKAGPCPFPGAHITAYGDEARPCAFKVEQSYEVTS